VNEENKIGERIRQVRKYYQLTQLEFGERLGCSKSSIINYEKGERSPDTVFLVRLLKEFNVDSNWLLLGTGKMPKYSKDREVLGDDVLQMIEHLRIPAIKLSIMAEYERFKKIFAPLIKEFEEKKNSIETVKGSR